MHIPDGFLNTATSAVTWVAAAGGVSYGARRLTREMDESQAPLLGVTAAFIFAAQMMNFTVAGGTSGHLLGGALAAILLGPGPAWSRLRLSSPCRRWSFRTAACWRWAPTR